MTPLLKSKPTSAETAKERLKLVLTHDRSDIPPGVMEIMRDEIIEVIMRHIDVDKESVSLQIARDGRNQSLIADIPIRQKNHRRGY